MSLPVQQASHEPDPYMLVGFETPVNDSNRVARDVAVTLFFQGHEVMGVELPRLPGLPGALGESAVSHVGAIPSRN